jgi:hypothetical protein
MRPAGRTKQKPGDEPGFYLYHCATTCNLTNSAPIENPTRYDDCKMNLALVWRVNDEDLLMVRRSRRKMRSEE